MVKKRSDFKLDSEDTEMFERIFGVRFSSYMDSMLTVVSKRPCIDIMKFDDFLHKKFGDYDDGDNPMSMRELLDKEYGEEASKLIERLI